MQAFESIEPRDPEPRREGLTLTCASHNGVKVLLALKALRAIYWHTGV